MNKIFKPTLLPLFTLIAGAVGFGLRLWLFLSLDEKGLLGALTGGLTAAAGGTAAALVFSFLGALIFKGKRKD